VEVDEAGILGCRRGVFLCVLSIIVATSWPTYENQAGLEVSWGRER